jgi:hypothetical protein
MLHKTFASPLIILAAVLALSSCCASKMGKPIGNYSVESVFATIHSQFQSALDTLKNDTVVSNRHFYVFPTEADLVLDNVVTADAGASLSILIFSPSYTLTKKKETTLTFSLLNNATPTPPPMVTKAITLKNDPNALRNLIVNTAEEMARLKYNFDAANPDSIQRQIEIDIAFTLDNTYGLQIGGSITSALSATGTAGLDVANTHTITVKFQLLPLPGSQSMQKP